MKCPHCGVSFHEGWRETHVEYWGGVPTYRRVRSVLCPACDKFVLELGRASKADNQIGEWELIEPKGANRGPVPPEVPTLIADDYVEACNVLPISPKASAALARRCLQAILRSQGYKATDLAKEIDMVLDEKDASKSISGSLRTVIDGIRNFGNFSAHPINDVNTLQIIDVEPEEAEWCLEVLEECFDFFYVRPAQATARKAALDAKLSAAGKPPSKG